ncbi:hypothetical protein FACS189492_0470 [Clostridia bacterium]|nr:hypothetical protein FACS189492_0470 [Clostridia bacterium]
MDKNQFPKEMAAFPNWVCWRLETDKSGRDTKVPYCPATGRRASAANAATWGTLDEVLLAKDKYLFHGVGFVFTLECGIIGIDIDHCLDPAGNPNETAADILSRLPATYIEVSPSGSGLHIFLRGVLPKGGNRKGGVEMYAISRFFTMTGNRWKDCADSVSEENGAIAYIHKKHINPPRQRSRSVPAENLITDEELLRLANASKDGAAFGKLYGGDWQGKFKSQSEADFALCCKLAFWSGRGEAQIDRLFRKSGLFREKWDATHSADGSTYGETTVRNACAYTVKTYAPPKQKPDVSEIFEQYGVYYRNRNDKVYQLTNFVIEPIEMIEAEDETQLTCDLVTQKGERFRQTFLANDFANLQRLKNILTKRTIALSFFGGEGDLEQFKQFVDGLNWTKKRGKKALGIYPHNKSLVFVDTKGAVGVGGKKVSDIVQLEKYKGLESDILTASMITRDELQLLAGRILSYNTLSRTVPLLAWMAGCFIKPHLRRAGIKFPHLFLIGEPGSGKSSSLERILLPVFGKNKISAASQTTAFTLMKESNSSNIIPQCLDEFKPSKLDKTRISGLYNHFRDSYDWHEGVRGRADQTQVLYDLLAPIAVAGEESADEGAIRERSIELLFSKKDLKADEHKAAFAWLIESGGLLRSFGRSLLDTALRTTPKETKEWHSEGLNYFAKELPTRITNNLCAMYAGLCLIGKLCASAGLAFDGAFPLDHEACAANLEAAAREYLLDDSSYNKGAVEQAFEVMARMKLKVGEDYAFENNNQYLCICLSGVYDRYTRYRRDYAILGEVLTYGQFRKQLEHAEYFVSKNRQKRFGEQNKKVWVVDCHRLGKLCDVSYFQRDEAAADGGGLV